MLGSQPVADAEGLISTRPAASRVSARYVWFSRDINQFSISDGTDWLDFRAMQTVVSGYIGSKLTNAPLLSLQGYAGIPTERVELELSNSGGGGSTGIFKKYTTDFTSASTVTILGTAHGIGTKALVILVYDSTGNSIDADIDIDTTTFDVVLTFTATQSGYVVIV
jgi:hypothetical protein